jgi:hypothetical protein
MIGAYRGGGRLVVWAVLLAAGCAACGRGAGAPAAAEPSGGAVPADEWSEFEAAASDVLVRLAAGAGCAEKAEGSEPWCRAAAEWPQATALGFEPDSVGLMAGLTVVLSDGEAGQEAFLRPLLFSVVTVSNDAAGLRVRAVVAKPESDAETAEVRDAVGWSARFLNGMSPGVKVTGGLVGFVQGQKGRADTPATLAGPGLRYASAQARGELRHLGTLWVLIERPVGADGMMVSMMSSTLAFEP